MTRYGWPALVLLLALAALGAACGGSQAAPKASSVSSGRTLDLATLAEPLAARYRFIERHQPLAQRIPCYCGCARLGHHDLRDCFITRQGGYEEHATTCGVCQAEAADVETLLGQGLDASAIRSRIDQTYRQMGPSTNTP